MAKGTLVIIAPSGAVTNQRIERSKGPSLEVLQAAVGGYIERVRVRWSGRVCDAYVNEDGISKGFTLNTSATLILDGAFKNSGNNIVGPCAVWVPDAKVASSDPRIDDGAA
jgi:hypothetical protein